MLIAGLGNPGKKYENTRHNAGFKAADALASHFAASFKQAPKLKGALASFVYGGEKHYILKPDTYMNLSGDSIALVMNYYRISPSELLTITDDISLPVGKVRIRESGSAGGHNGLKSVISHLGSNFARIRIGVDQPVFPDKGLHPDKMINHVLGDFSKQDNEILETVYNDLPAAVRLILEGKILDAMTVYNAKNYC